MLVGSATREELKKLIVETLNLDGITPDVIDDDAPLFGEELGLDSVDALELVVAIEKTYGVKIADTDEVRVAFQSVASLSEYVHRLRDEAHSQGG